MGEENHLRCLLGGEFGRLLAAQGAIEFFQRPQARIGDVPVDELGKPRMANPREARNLGPVAATRLKCYLQGGVKAGLHSDILATYC